MAPQSLGRFLLQCAGVPILAYLWSLYPPLPMDAWSFDLFARSAAMLIIPLCGLFLLRSPKPDTAQRGVAGWMFVNRKQLCAMKWYGRGSIADPDLRKLRRKIDRALEALGAYHGFSWLPANIPQHSPRRRWFALRCTGYGPEELLQALPSKAHPSIAMLHSFDFDRRAWGARHLGELGKAALPAVTHLIRMLGDVPSWSVSTLYGKDPMKNVRAARMALIRIGEPVIPYLIQAIQKAHDGIAYEAGSLLQVIAKDKGRRILTQLSRDPVPEIRKRAAALLGRTKHAEQKAWAEALLLEALQDRNRGVREQAARSLGRLTIRSSVPQAIRLGPTPPRRILEQTAFPITDLPYGRSWSPPRVAQGTVTEVKKAGK